MNASDDKVFEDMVQTVEVIENLESEVHATIMTSKPKSATKSMMTHKTFCTSQIKSVNDAVKEYREKNACS